MTCLCLTRNRREWLPKAIQCFLDQTYPNRELLIVSDGVSVTDLVPDEQTLQRSGARAVRLFHADRAAEIGEKRNFGCSLAEGEIIAHWDDDDFSAPDRLADQVRRLRESGKAVTGYRSMRFVRHTDGKQWQFTYQPGKVLGTSLCFKRDWWERNQFPRIQIQEDQEFVVKAWNQHQLDEGPDETDLMYATVHTGNTSPRNFQNPGYRAL